jgi:transposase
MTAIGIDMSKSTFHAAFDGSTVQIFRNTDEGIASFFTALEARSLTKDDVAIGVEATGAYHLMLCGRCLKEGWRIVVINPLETSLAIKARSLRKVKTDRTDALVIRTVTALGHGYPFADTEDVLALKTLITERQGLVRMRTMLKGQREAHAAKQRAMTMPLHDSIAPVLTALGKEIRAIEKQCAAYAPNAQKLLRSIPGVGVTTAAALVAFVGNVNRFSSPEKLTAYVGLDCRVHESGTSVHGKGFISKRGNGYLRHLLFNAAFIARQKNPALKQYFEGKMKEGKHYTSALCAVERKLLHLIYAVWKRGTPFEDRKSTGA